MPRFYLPPEQCCTANLVLAGREAHHALHVLRLRRGDRVTVVDGAGRQFVCELREHDRDKVALAVVETHSLPPLPCQVTLLQAVPKGKLIESIIQKATELGAVRIVPLLSERVATKLDAKAAADKAIKWRAVAIEAIKQCGAAWLPRVDVPLTPEQFLQRGEQFELPLIASLQDDRQHPRKWFLDFQTKHGRPPHSVCVWIGPEGDFTPAEVQAIQSAGALPISLGSLVLRTETAAIYCLSIFGYELQAQVIGVDNRRS
jgi:16S rRNA (uracil1498-N3)-methyltransferase